jgi:hypothetical protein
MAPIAAQNLIMIIGTNNEERIYDKYRTSDGNRTYNKEKVCDEERTCPIMNYLDIEALSLSQVETHIQSTSELNSTRDLKYSHSP